MNRTRTIMKKARELETLTGLEYAIAIYNPATNRIRASFSQDPFGALFQKKLEELKESRGMQDEEHDHEADGNVCIAFPLPFDVLDILKLFI